MKKYHFRFVWLRLVVAFLAAFQININGHLDLIPKAIVSPKFYVAFIISFGVAYLMLYLIHLSNRILDLRYPWQRNKLIRAILQIVFGVMLPAATDVLFISIYFFTAEPGYLFTDFLKYDFLTVLIFIAFVNIVYVIFNQFKLKYETLEIDYNGVYVRLNVTTDILFFYRDRKLIKVYTTYGKVYLIKDTISRLKERYEVVNFCQINPSAVVNLDMLQGYIAGTTRDTLQLLFKIKYHAIVENDDPRIFRVTKDRIENFKQRFEKLQ